jgi:hypothetical protein
MAVYEDPRRLGGDADRRRDDGSTVYLDEP